MGEHRSIIKSAGIISASTITSRVLGLIRDILTAMYFGTGMIADAFVISFMIPNMFRRLFGEGALNSAFVPVFSQHLATREKKQAFLIANIVISIMLVVLSSIVIFIMLGTFFIQSFYNISPKLCLTPSIYAVETREGSTVTAT